MSALIYLLDNGIPADQLPAGHALTLNREVSRMRVLLDCQCGWHEKVDFSYQGDTYELIVKAYQDHLPKPEPVKVEKPYRAIRI